MTTAFYTLGDMNGKNLKTAEAKAIDNAFEGNYVFSRDTILPFGSFLPKLSTLLGKRGYMDKLLDRKAYKPQVDYAICLPHSFYETCKELKGNGTKIINCVSSGAGKRYSDLVKEEHKSFGIELKEDNTRAVKSAMQSDYIIVTSNWFKGNLVAEGFPEENIYMSPTGVDIERFKPGKKEDDVFRVVCVADFHLMKGLYYLLEAWKEADLDNAELVLVGNLDKVTQGQVKSMSTSNVKHVGHQDPVSYYQNSSLFILPSLSEGCSRVMLEAMACGIPVCVTEHIGARIKDRDKEFNLVTEDTGFITPIRDSGAIKAVLEYGHHNQEELMAMGKNAHAYAKNFTWDNYTKRIKEIMVMIK
jgi:glycosyltransferase involved in cell wall biosynthesis